jgi:hypothetical protein
MNTRENDEHNVKHSELESKSNLKKVCVVTALNPD